MNQIHPDTHYRIQRSAQQARINRSRQPKVERPATSGAYPKIALIAALVTTLGGYIAFI